MRFLTAGVVAAFATCGAMSCLIAYSSYDSRFQNDGGESAFVTDDGGIVALAVTQTDLFYATGDVIKRVSLDGGATTTWWTEDAAVTDLASDQSTTLAWTAKDVIRKAALDTPQSSTVVAASVGMFDKLASNTVGVAWFQGGQTNCPCVIGGVEPWDSGAAIFLTYDDASDSGKVVAPSDVAIDEQGVVLFIPNIGNRRYAFDGGLSCAIGSGLQGGKALHGMALGASGSPFYAIASGAAPQPLTQYASACVQENASGTTLALGVMSDGQNFFWLSGEGTICGPSLDAGMCIALPNGAVTAMTYDAQSIYVAIGSSIYRFAKPE
jgi:hypothetical protein